MRREYGESGLSETDMAPTWVDQLAKWLTDAISAELLEANAMVVATAAASGAPSARTVLLKGIDARGLVFFTNYGSRKGHELTANPAAAACFPWIALDRQVIVTGPVERVSDEESDAYFAGRPHGSQIGAHASPQSQVIPSRRVLDDAYAELDRRWPEGTAVPRPPGWGGFRIVPDAVEFWQGRPDRLHDRLRYRREAEHWVLERLAP